MYISFRTVIRSLKGIINERDLMELGRRMSYQMTSGINRVTRVVEPIAFNLNVLNYRNLFVTMIKQ